MSARSKQLNFGRRGSTHKNNEALSSSAPTRSDMGGNMQNRGCVTSQQQQIQHQQTIASLNANMYGYPNQAGIPTRQYNFQYAYPTTVTQNVKLAQVNGISASEYYAYHCTMAANYNAAAMAVAGAPTYTNYTNLVPVMSMQQPPTNNGAPPTQITPTQTPSPSPQMYIQTPQPQYVPFGYQPVVYQQAVPHFEQRNYNLLKQIEYYFSPANLKKDTFIRRHMNSEGYIPLILVPGFSRVQAISNDLFLISHLLQRSTEVELSPDGLQVRPRKDWKHWLLQSKLENESNHSHKKVNENNHNFATTNSLKQEI